MDAQTLHLAAALGIALAQQQAPLRVVCAWCTPGPPADGEIVSHGICVSCATRETARLRAEERRTR